MSHTVIAMFNSRSSSCMSIIRKQDMAGYRSLLNRQGPQADFCYMLQPCWWSGRQPQKRDSH
jgi:hypothetical protein